MVVRYEALDKWKEKEEDEDYRSEIEEVLEKVSYDNFHGDKLNWNNLYLHWCLLNLNVQLFKDTLHQKGGNSISFEEYMEKGVRNWSIFVMH